ncbi:MAG: hypothetical protein M1822_009306 [Bathelium mastoideum]|nr:MAG: hypothetical protein M1822_009306 [Bathelium mastoideum]
MDSHKRLKPGLARSFLTRGSSKHDVHQADPPEEASNPAAGASNPLSSRPHVSSQQSSRHRPLLSATMSPSISQPSVTRPSADQDESAAPSSPATAGASIEQSVRLFRLFESLRNGDTTAITRAIRGEQNDEAGTSPTAPSGRIEGTSILHLAIQCAELPVIEYVLSFTSDPSPVDVNGRDRDGNTPLHIASMLGRAPVVRKLLEQKDINDSIPNYQGQTALDLARSPDIYQQLQLARSIFVDSQVKKIQQLVTSASYDNLEKLLVDPRVRSNVDLNGSELTTDPQVAEAGGTLLHEAAKKKDMKLAQILLLNGADPFKRDRKGKLPQDYTKDDKTRAILKRSPAAAAAQRGVQEKAILGTGASPASQGATAGDPALATKEAREMKGYLKKWTNYTNGWKLRFFVLEDGVLSYYKHQDDAGSACRGAINMKIAKLHMDPSDKLRFEIHGKSSVKYHLRANHQVEAKRWYWSLNNAIQWTKDEAKEEEKRALQESEALKQAKTDQAERVRTREGDSARPSSEKARSLIPGTAVGIPSSYPNSRQGGSTLVDDMDVATSGYDPSVDGVDMGRNPTNAGANNIEGDLDDEDEEYGDDASSHEVQPHNKDAFNITAQSAKLQLDLLSQVCAALQSENSKRPSMPISDSSVVQALSSYESAVGNLKGLLGDLLRIARDRDAYWQYRLEREANVRRMWEDSMARVAREQEELQNKMSESEDKRKKTKRALRDALEGQASQEPSRHASQADLNDPEQLAAAMAETTVDGQLSAGRLRSGSLNTARRKTVSDLAQLSEDDSDEEDEFFDAVDAGEVEVAEELPASGGGLLSPPPSSAGTTTNLQDKILTEISPSFQGYEDGPRQKLSMDKDDRPKISLWGILKSMIGKDMTKMTLPVSFNEPTSLLQRVAEDMEYTELLDMAADRADSTERLVYVAAFAASEYASTIGRVAKPFNPLLGETYEYARPDKGYRFFIEQVSHHPPIGAAWAESPKWDYYGESAVKSKFYGKAFDINPLGTWFLRLRPTTPDTPPELYTWKKVTSSVIGIITGNPTVDNYGPMEVRNHTTGEVCTLDFKARGWKASSAYQVTGRVLDRSGHPRWSLAGRWNDKIYARLTPGYEGPISPAVASPNTSNAATAAASAGAAGADQKAFLVWEAHARPADIPFNLTPFVVTLNALPARLQPWLAPTDTRLRPDQRAMEEGAYDRAATEKHRVEEKQRAARRTREAAGEEFVPRWFRREVCAETGETYWRFNGEYWKVREAVTEQGRWAGCEDIF